MHKHLQVSFCIVILLSVSTFHSSFADVKQNFFGEVIPSPRQQLQNGTSIWSVVCWENLALMRNLDTNSIACVTISTGEKLLERGWELIKNPNSFGYEGVGFLVVSRHSDTAGFRFTAIPQDKLLSYPDLVYAMQVADLDYDNYMSWAKRMGCSGMCSMASPSSYEYRNTVDVGEAQKMIIDLGFQDYQTMPMEQNKTSGHWIHLQMDEKDYNVDIVGIKMP